jgi:hypothetical protein
MVTGLICSNGLHTGVAYQDFAHTPHSNDDVVTALLMLDDVTFENGCLHVPESHRGPIHSLSGLIVRGQKVRHARLMEGLVELPARRKMASVFAVQEQQPGAD